MRSILAWQAVVFMVTLVALTGCATTIGTFAGSVGAWFATRGLERYVLHDHAAVTVTADPRTVLRSTARALLSLDVHEVALEDGRDAQVLRGHVPNAGDVTIEIRPVRPLEVRAGVMRPPGVTRISVAGRTAFGPDPEFSAAVLCRVENEILVANRSGLRKVCREWPVTRGLSDQVSLGQ